MNKCAASEDGQCKNIWAFGMKCDGYNEQCGLKPHYDKLERFANDAQRAICKAIGLKSDRE